MKLKDIPIYRMLTSGDFGQIFEALWALCWIIGAPAILVFVIIHLFSH